tara:strand:- start:4751 stop:5101 length:351 start_codon:yes stop_codon:yes gene_type:complete
MTDVDKNRHCYKKTRVLEKDRYEFSGKGNGVVATCEKVSGSSLLFRPQKAIQTLKPHLDDKRVLEVGYANGLLYETSGKMIFTIPKRMPSLTNWTHSYHAHGLKNNDYAPQHYSTN